MMIAIAAAPASGWLALGPIVLLALCCGLPLLLLLFMGRRGDPPDHR